jgi:hypothetical protein
MDLVKLRTQVLNLVFREGVNNTHTMIPVICEKLGIASPEEGLTKKDRMSACVDTIQDDDIPGIAERLLTRFSLRPADRNALQDALWTNAGFPEITKRVRREIADAIEPDDLYIEAIPFDKLLGNLWVLSSDPLEAVEALLGHEGRSLRAQIEKHVHRNPGDWSVDHLFKELDVYNATDRRFALFLEGLASPDVRPNEEEQRRFVTLVNGPLKNASLEMRETGQAGGYPTFEVVPIHAAARGRPKNLIFASSVKPDLRFSDALDNDVEIVTGADQVLVFDRPIGREGLHWADLQSWWAEREGEPDPEKAKISLYRRLRQSLPTDSPPQLALFDAYYKGFGKSVPLMPALLPEVWLHWDPKTIQARGKNALLHCRMDFLLLLPHNVRVVVEVDGKQHYANDRGHADPTRYACMMAADREMRLSGYDVYRFGAAQLSETSAPSVAKDFFIALFKLHGITT